MRTIAPGAIRTRWRRANTGSSTVPTVFDNGRPSSHGDRPVAVVATAEEPGPVGFHFRLPHRLAVNDGQMRGPNLLLGRRPPPPCCQDGAEIGEILGFDEQLHEGRMRDIVGLRCQHQFGIGRHVDLACPVAGIGNRNAADLGVALARNQHLQHGGQRSVVPGDFGAILIEHDFIAVGLGAAGLESGGPYIAAVHIAQVDVGAPVVARGILAPPRHRDASPAAVAGTGGGQHHRVLAVRQQVGRERRIVRGGKPPSALRADRAARSLALPRRPRDAPRRRRAACLPATATRSPAPSVRHGTARASRHPAMRRRWRRSSCPDGAPCRRARSQRWRPPAGGSACSPAPRRSRSGRAHRCRQGARSCVPPRSDRPWSRAPSHKAPPRHCHPGRASGRARERRNWSIGR